MKIYSMVVLTLGKERDVSVILPCWKGGEERIIQRCFFLSLKRNEPQRTFHSRFPGLQQQATVSSFSLILDDDESSYILGLYIRWRLH